MFTLKCRQAHIFATVSLPVSLTLLAIKYRWWHCYRQLIISGVIVTGNKVITGVMELIKNQGQGFITGNIDTGNNS
jgi:hypothetical protein